MRPMKPSTAAERLMPKPRRRAAVVAGSRLNAQESRSYKWKRVILATHICKNGAGTSFALSAKACRHRVWCSAPCVLATSLAEEARTMRFCQNGWAGVRMWR
jgi:hypothetical protein